MHDTYSAECGMMENLSIRGTDRDNSLELPSPASRMLTSQQYQGDKKWQFCALPHDLSFIQRITTIVTDHL